MKILNIVILFMSGIVWTKGGIILELYFFRNISNYEELKKKTFDAYKKKSINKRKVKIVKSIKLQDANNYFENLKNDNKYVIDNLELMKIENGVWHCIEIVAYEKSIIIMADGYPYAKFSAMRFEFNRNK